MCRGLVLLWVTNCSGRISQIRQVPKPSVVEGPHGRQGGARRCPVCVWLGLCPGDGMGTGGMWGVEPGVAAQPHCAHTRAQERGQATSWLTAWWGNGNFPLALAAAPDLKTTNTASPGRSARAGVQMRCDSPRHTRMATSWPAVLAGRRCPSRGCSRRREARAGPQTGPNTATALMGPPQHGARHHNSLTNSSAIPGGLAKGCPVLGGLAISVPFRSSNSL